MSDGIQIDASDISKLAADIGRAPSKSGRTLRQAMEVTATKIRDAARQKASGLEHAPAFPASITYDIGANHSLLRETFGAGGADSIVAEIGPDKDRPQGALGNLLEFGSVNNSPRGIMHGALQENESDFEKGLEKAIDDALKGVGL